MVLIPASSARVRYGNYGLPAQLGLPMSFLKKLRQEKEPNWSSMESGWLVGPVWLSMAKFSVDFMTNYILYVL